ncbi:MAG: OmpA family protein [Saprospiraceae bacterium]
MNKFILFFILLFPGFLYSQNLILNGDFEKHESIDFRIRGATQPDNWNNIGTVLCDCNFKERVNKTHGKNCIDSVKAANGCSMVVLGYTPGAKCISDGTHTGWASHISTKTVKTLEIGKYYKVSYWIYYSEKHNIDQHPEVLKNLGLLLTYHPVIEDNCLIEARGITNDNYEFNKWFKIEKIIIPTCELNYLSIGIFRNKDWLNIDHFKYSPTTYFVDNVSIIEILKEEVKDENSIIYFCNELPEPPKKIAKIDETDYHVYFSTNVTVPLDFEALDKMAAAAKANTETIFLVSGHTDNVGTDNYELSKKRVEAVVDYLTSNHKIPKYRLITAHFGDTQPIAPNDTEVNRAKNRRVTIEALGMRKSKGIYRQALIELKNGNNVEALKLFRGWEMNEEDSEKILAYFDIKTDDLRQDNRWSVIDKAIRKSYEQYSKPKYAFILDSLYCEDQKYRRLNTYVQDLAGYIKIIDTLDWKYPTISNDEWRTRDSLIYLNLKQLLIENGFPKQTEVGKRSARSAAVILIHSHDTIAIKKYLPILHDYCKQGEAQFGYYAMMYDKLCVLQNKGQRYGTQYLSNPENPSEMVLAKLENTLKINDFREQITLPPLKEETIDKALKE